MANGKLESAINTLSNDFKEYYNNFVFLNDVYKVFLATGRIGKALSFFSNLNSVYKEYYLGLINLRLKTENGLHSIVNYIENSSLENKSYRLEMLNEIFSNLIFTQNARNYFHKT